MKLRLGRREVGPGAIHNNRYGPRSAPTITAIQRNAIYRQILDRLSEAGDLSSLVEPDNTTSVRRLAREVSDDLALILDGLGWGKTASGGAVELALPPDQLRRVFSRLRERATEQREAASLGPSGAQAPYERPDHHRDLRSGLGHPRRRVQRTRRMNSKLADRGAPEPRRARRKANGCRGARRRRATPCGRPFNSARGRSAHDLQARSVPLTGRSA